MFKSTRTQTLKDYDFKIKQIFFFLPLIFCQSCIIFAKQCVCKRGTNSPLQHVKCWRTLLKLSPIPGSYPLPLVNICPLRAESPFKSLVQYQLSSVYVATSPFEGQNWKLMVGNEPKAKHLLCFIVIMQNGTGVPRPLNWLTSCAKMRKVLNDNKGCESIFITRKNKHYFIFFMRNICRGQSEPDGGRLWAAPGFYEQTRAGIFNVPSSSVVISLASWHYRDAICHVSDGNGRGEALAVRARLHTSDRVPC